MKPLSLLRQTSLYTAETLWITDISSEHSVTQYWTNLQTTNTCRLSIFGVPESDPQGSVLIGFPGTGSTMIKGTGRDPVDMM